eukprot:CAMPEP_0113412508 /NCGR_PEP_ID=MMETSP0013_2-20120614/22880_1 /TAXON_ID=2843 ORGANISM="Skeletonema costatum, Strain 1716" /NCGR_SAMPLE_ID=MMETSP0013_2 /ASSEMBLY_ACC=CAM_ASM_000158 /LENGTH=306 /DNA_ID=CAMNT_0000299021 /DNA_START=69 /DNA_END=989 /DNA_ORIENTATION=+ /assembly_acc=CAM_ASM_000158
MPNIHGLSSIRNNNDRRPPTNNNSDSDSEDNDENNRYVGGVSSRGGGSGLAVLPNHESSGGGGRNAAAASDSIFNLAEAGGEQAATAGAGGGEVRRMITMYRSGFTVDNGPYRRLEDPSNAEFLGSLARGLIPRELREDAEESGGGEVMVGLVDKRGEEYDEDRHGQQQQRGGNGGFGGGSGGGDGFQSFSGEGQSLVDSSSAAAATAPSGGVIDPNTNNTTSPPPALDESKPSTSIAIRLLNGKRLVVKINLDSPVLELGQHIGSQAGGESYVLTSGYPPAVIEDLSVSVEEAGLKGAQVVLKKA